MKKTFLSYDNPLLTATVQDPTPEEMICTIKNALYDGADAFSIQLEFLKKEYHTEACLRDIFSNCDNKPIYITSYRSYENTGMTDDECAQLLLLGLQCGATLCDVMGDLYHPEPHELTFTADAVEKQKALIHKIHELGGEVLISSHLHAFFHENEILRYAAAQIERGADIVKIVSFAQNEEQMIADFNIIHRLKKELKKPFLFLANGAYSQLIRQLGPVFGVCMYLCVQQYRPYNYKEQPQLRAMKTLRDSTLFSRNR